MKTIGKIPKEACNRCYFFNLNDNGAYCNIYIQKWKITEKESRFDAPIKKPEFCKAVTVIVIEKKDVE